MFALPSWASASSPLTVGCQGKSEKDRDAFSAQAHSRLSAGSFGQYLAGCGPTASPTPSRSFFLASLTPLSRCVQLDNEGCLLLLQDTSVTENGGLEVVRDQRKFQFIILDSPHPHCSQFVLHSLISHPSSLPDCLPSRLQDSDAENQFLMTIQPVPTVL